VASTSKQPNQNLAPIADDVSHPPFDTRELRKGLKGFMDSKVIDPIRKKPVRVGSYQYGVYAFYDYDGEPIYVGQTREKLSGRVSRHLTNQRTDAVAMSVLDPFEVCEVEVWPLPQLDGLSKNDPKIQTTLNAVEAAVYQNVLKKSKFGAVLNEKIPSAKETETIPQSFRGRIVSDEIIKVRSHPDLRLARRAATLARLAQIISERKVGPGLRQVLLIQAKRLEWLAARRFVHFMGDVEAGHAEEEEEEDEDEEQED
jgi:hypothetical protein